MTQMQLTKKQQEVYEGKMTTPEWNKRSVSKSDIMNTLGQVGQILRGAEAEARIKDRIIEILKTGPDARIITNNTWLDWDWDNHKWVVSQTSYNPTPYNLGPRPKELYRGNSFDDALDVLARET